MTSTRTEYRIKRIDLITDIINELSKLLLLYKRDLETIKLPLLKKLHDDVFSLRKSRNERKDFPTDSKKDSLPIPKQKRHGRRIKSKEFTDGKNGN